MDNGPLQRGKESFNSIASNRALEQILQAHHSTGIPPPHDLTPNRENFIVANDNEERQQSNPYCHPLQGDIFKCRDCPNYFSRYLTSIRRHLAKQHDVQSDWEAHIQNDSVYSAPFSHWQDSEERVPCPLPSSRLTPEPIPMDSGNRHKFLNDGTPEQTDDKAKAEKNRSSPLSGGHSEIQDNQPQALPLIQCPHCNFAVLATNLYALGQHLITQHPGDLTSVNSHTNSNLNCDNEEGIQSQARSNSFGESTGPLEAPEPNSSKTNHPESAEIISKIRKINVNADIPGSVPKINFKCPLCDFTSEYKQSIKRHLDYRHHVRDQLQQVSCKNGTATDASASNRESPSEDMTQNTPPPPIITTPVQCELCEAYFLTEQAHTKHKLTAHPAPPLSISSATRSNNTQGYRCPICPFTSDDGAQFLVHFKGHDTTSTPLPPTTVINELTAPTSQPLQNSTAAATKHSKLFEALKKPSRPYFAATKNASAITSLTASNPGIALLQPVISNSLTKDFGEDTELDGKELLTNVLLKCSLCQYSTTNHDNLAEHQVFKHRISMLDVEDRSLKLFTKFPNAPFEDSQIHDSHDSFDITDAKEGLSEVDERIPLLKLYLQQSSAPTTSRISTTTRASGLSSMPTLQKLVIYSCRFCTFCDASHDSVRDHESSHHTPADLPELTRIGPNVENVKSSSSPWDRESNVSQETAEVSDENPSNTTYTCRYCGYSHHLQRIVLQHETNKHFKHLQDLVPGQKFVRCKDCNYIAPSKAMLVKHRAEHDEGPMYCKFCDFSTFYSPNLERHLKRHAVKSLYRCHKCSYSSPSNQGIILHRDRHHNGRQFNITSAQATKLYFDRRKFKTDDPNAPGAESVCDELEVYNRHAEPQNLDKNCWPLEPPKMGDNTNSGRTSYPCPVDCGYEATTLSDLQFHITTLHGAQCSITECNLCHTMVDSLAQYMAHLSDLHPLTHKKRVDPSPPLLQEKEKLIPTQNLAGHQSQVEAPPKRIDTSRTNANAKTGRPEVPHISRRYPHLGYPNRPVYKRVLPHEKDKHCTLCAYSTKWSCDLRLHYRNRHKVSKPYECQDCKRTFAYASDLRTHLKKTHGVDSRTALYEKVYSTFKGGVPSPSPNSLPSNSTPEPAKFNVGNGLCEDGDSTRDCASNGPASEEPSKNLIRPSSQFSSGPDHDLSSSLGFNTFEGILSSSPNLLQLFAQYTKHLASQQKSFEVAARDTANNESGDKLINTTLLNRLGESESFGGKPVVPLTSIKSGVGRRTLRLKGSLTHKAKVNRGTTSTPQNDSNLFENGGREEQTNGMDACTSFDMENASPLLGKLITANTNGQPDQDSDQDFLTRNTVIRNISYPLRDNHARGKVIVKFPIAPSQPGKRLKLTSHTRDSMDNLGNASSINQYFDLARMFKQEQNDQIDPQNSRDNNGTFNLDFLQNYRVKGETQMEGHEGDSFLNAYNLINQVVDHDYQREPAVGQASVYQTVKTTSESCQNLGKTEQQPQTSVSGPVKNSNISRTGNGKNVFGCPVCSYISNCAAKIKLHIAIHASEKLYNCSECGKRSYWSWDISKHIKAKHATAVGACTMKSPQAMKEIAELSKLPIRIMKPRGNGASDEFVKTGPNPPTKILRMEHQLYMHRQNLLQQKGTALVDNDPEFSKQRVTEGDANFGVLKPDTAKNESRACKTTEENAPELQNDRVKTGVFENAANASCSYYSNPLLVYRCKFCEYKNARRLSTERHVYQVHGYKVTRRRQGQQQSTLQNNAGADPSSQDFVEDRDILTLDSSAIMPVVDNYYDRITPVNGQPNATTSGQAASKLGIAVNPQLVTSTHSGPVTRVVTNSLTTTAAGNPRTNVFPCTICPFISNKATAFKRHQELHEDPCSLSSGPVVPFFKCPFCPYFVPLKRMLWQHLRMHVPNPQEILNRLRHYDPSAQCCDIDDAPLYEEQVKLTPYNLPWAWDQKAMEEINVKEQSVNGGGEEEEKSGDLNDYRRLIPDDEGDDNSIKITNKGTLPRAEGKLSHLSGLSRDTFLVVPSYDAALQCPKNDHKPSYSGNEESHMPPAPAEKSPNKRKARVPFSLSSMLGTAVRKDQKNQELKQIYADYMQKNDDDSIKTTPYYNGEEKLSSTVEPSNTVKQQDDTWHEDLGKDSTEHNISYSAQALPISNDDTLKGEKHNLSDQIEPNQPSEDSLIPSEPPKPCRWGKDGNDISVAWGLKKGKYVRMFKCPYCPHLGTRRANVRIHISLHGMRQGMKGKLQHCPKCTFNCANPTRYMNHISMHADGIEKIPNTQSSQPGSFKSDPDSNRTEDYHKDRPSKKLKVDLRCPHCPAKFCLERMLKRHMKFHSRRFKFHCKECTYTAPKAYQLVRHYKLHTSLSPPLSPEVTDGFTTSLIDPQIAMDSLYNSSPAENTEDHHQVFNEKNSFSSHLLRTLVRGVDFMTKSNKRLQSTSNRDLKQAFEPSLNKLYEREGRFESQDCKGKRPNSAPTINFERINNLLAFSSNGSRCKLHVGRRDISCQNCNYGRIVGDSLPHNKLTQLKAPPSSQTSVIRENPFKSRSKSEKTTHPLPNPEFLHFCQNCGRKVNDQEYPILQRKVKESSQSRVILCDICTKSRNSQPEMTGENEVISNGNMMNNKINFDNNVFSTFLDHKPPKVDHSNDLPIKSS